MKKIRKIPIILSSLVLATTGTGCLVPVMALNDNEPKGGNDQLVLTKNVNNPYIQVDSIGYKNGRVLGTVTAPAEGDWYIKTIAIAYMNFNQGVTEAEADEALSDFTGLKDEKWMVLNLSEYHALANVKTKNIDLNSISGVKNILANKSDLLYYAVEFGRPSEGQQWGETWWYRGKLDYRACVHSAVFDEDTMSCKRVEDDDNVKYVPQVNATKELVYPPENEKVLSWETEWQNVIIANYEVVQDEIEVMTNYFNNGLMVLDENEKVLDGVDKSLKKITSLRPNLIGLAQSVALRKVRIAELREFFTKSGGDVAEIERLTQENERIKAENAELGQKNEQIRTENTELGQKNADLERKYGELVQKNQSLEEEKANLRQESEILGQKVEDLRTEKEELIANLTKIQAERDEAERAKQEVENENLKLKEEMEKMAAKNEAIEAERAVMETQYKTEIEQLKFELEQSKTQGVTVVEKPVEKEKVTVVEKPIEREIVTVIEKPVEKEKVMVTEKLEEAQNVDVPLLGDEELRTSGVWWWLIPVVGLVGALILVLKRKFARG